jgi:hypothetical protein
MGNDRRGRVGMSLSRGTASMGQRQPAPSGGLRAGRRLPPSGLQERGLAWRGLVPAAPQQRPGEPPTPNRLEGVGSTAAGQGPCSPGYQPSLPPTHPPISTPVSTPGQPIANQTTKPSATTTGGPPARGAVNGGPTAGGAATGRGDVLHRGFRPRAQTRFAHGRGRGEQARGCPPHRPALGRRSSPTRSRSRRVSGPRSTTPSSGNGRSAAGRLIRGPGTWRTGRRVVRPGRTPDETTNSSWCRRRFPWVRADSTSVRRGDCSRRGTTPLTVGGNRFPAGQPAPPARPRATRGTTWAQDALDGAFTRSGRTPGLFSRARVASSLLNSGLI